MLRLIQNQRNQKRITVTVFSGAARISVRGGGPLWGRPHGGLGNCQRIFENFQRFSKENCNNCIISDRITIFEKSKTKNEYFFGKVVAKIRASWNSITFRQQCFPFGGFYCVPPGGAYALLYFWCFKQRNIKRFLTFLS